MVVPHVRAGMKQAHDVARYRVDTGNVAALMPVAVKTRERQVTDLGRSLMLSGYYVVDLKWASGTEETECGNTHIERRPVA